MAQYLPFIPDVLPEPVVYAPDFNFFDKMLQKKQLQYEQGVSKAKIAYQSVLNAPLSDKANIPLRDQYIKQAEDGLKQIASSDLSLPENQQIAENLYAPFWQDKLMMEDTKLTKWYQSQAEKLNNWRTSSDAKIREQYNGITTQYLNNGLSALQNANRNADAYSKVEKREATPWTNIEGYLEKMAKDNNLSVKYDDPSGPYLVSTENGQRSQKKYATWAQSVMGNNFYEQFRVTGVVEKEQRIKDTKKLHPTWTDDQVMKFISEDVITELNDGFTKRNEEVNVELVKINSLLSSLPATLSPDQQNTFTALVNERAQLIAKRDGINQEYKNFDQPDKDKIRNAVFANADGYFGVLAKQRVINNWSTGRASIESKTIKENTAFTTAQAHELNRQKFLLDVRKQNFDEANTIWEREHPEVKTSKDGKDKDTKTTEPTRDAFGNIIEPPVNAVDQTTLGVYQGLGTTNILEKNKSVAFDIFNNYQKDIFKGANDLMFDTKGLLLLTKIGLGLTQEEITLVSSFWGKEMKSKSVDPEATEEYTASKEEAVALNKLSAKLLANDAVKNAGITKVTGPGTFKNALVTYAQDYYAQRLNMSKDGYDVPLRDEEVLALTAYTTATTMFDTYNANEENRRAILDQNLKTNPEFKNVTIERNGKRELLGVNDISKDMPELVLKSLDGKGSVQKLSRKDVAKLFIQGELKIGADPMAGGSETFINGVKYSVTSVNGISSRLGWASNAAYVNAMSGAEKKYGTSQEFSTKIKAAYESVVPNLLYYQTRTGQLGQEWYYNFDKKNIGDKASLLFNNAFSPANATLYDNNGNLITDPEIANALKMLFQNKEDNMEKYVQGFTYKSLGVNGKPTISFNLGEISAETKQEIGNVALNKLNQQIYQLEIDESTMTNLRDLPKNTGNYIYGAILQGNKLVSDPIIAASGFDFEIIPNKMGKDAEPSSAHLTLNYRKRVNEKNKAGELITRMEPVKVEVDFSLRAGDNRKTPDEIVNYIYKLYYDSMVKNSTTLKEYQTAITSGTVTNPKTGQPIQTVTKDEMFKKAGINPNTYNK